MEKKNVIKFKKAYTFEGEDVKEIDLSGMEELTSQNLINANRIYTIQTGMPAISESDLYYTFILAAEVSNKPLNFFEKLKAKDGLKIKRIVSDFLFLED